MKRFEVLVCLLFLLGPKTQAAAQVNIEKLRAKPAASGFSSSVQLDLSTRSGNVDIHQFGIRTRSDYVNQNWSGFLVTQGGMGWQGGKRYSNEGLAHLRQVFRPHSHTGLEIFAQVDYDRERRLEFRGLIGGGVRWRFFQRSGVRSWWGTAYMLEHERLDLGEGDPHPAEVSVHRWSNYLTTKAEFSEGTSGTWTAYVQPRFDKPEDIRILGEASLSGQMGHGFGLVLSFRLRYDSRPPDRIESLDTALRSGVKVEF